MVECITNHSLYPASMICCAQVKEDAMTPKTRRANNCIEIWSPILGEWLPLPLTPQVSDSEIVAYIKAHGILNNVHLF